MNDLKAAVRLLLGAGKVILPNALKTLQSIEQPSNVAKKIIELEASEEEITKELVLKYSTTDTSQIPSEIKQQSQRMTKKKHNRLVSKLLQPSALEQQTIEKPIIREVPQSRGKTIIQTSLDDLIGLHSFEPRFEIIREPMLSPNLAGKIEDIVGYFQNRFHRLSNLFQRRSDINDLTSIKNLKPNHNQVSIIGMLTEKNISSENSGKLILEDPTTERLVEGIIADNPVLIEKAVQLMNDTVICVSGSVKNENFFVKEIFLPEIPHNRDFVTADIPVHVAFLSDIHVGSKKFLEKPMDRFVKFLNGNYGSTKMQKLGKQTKYLLFSGDVVDGVGIYPNQLDDLAIHSIEEQYNIFASFVEKIPQDVQIVIIPGNHDMVRSAEPQPRIPPQYVPSLEAMDNVYLLPNPSQVSLHGVQTLLYHCTSLPDILNNIPGLSIDAPVEVMKHMLRARHLAPIWGDKTPIASEPEDHLVIDPVPDIFHGGHIHINGEGGYRGVQIINSGTMQEQTSYQKSLNIVPTPGQVSLVNLKDRKLNRIDFLTS